MSVRKREWTTRRGETKTAWVVDYTDQGGTRRLKTFAKKKEADAFAAMARVEVRAGTHVADSATITIEEAGRLWLQSGDAAGLERATLDQYRQHVDFHIVPFIGREKLSKVTVPFVRSFQDRLREEDRSPAMVKRATVSLGSLLADAQERGLVTRNAVREMSRRRGKGKARQAEKRQKRRLAYGVDIPTREEIKAIVEQAKGRYRPLLITAIFTGLRASELRGLRWEDVNLDAKRLHVRQRADRYNAIGMPKSDSGKRTVPLPPLVVSTLREWRLTCPMRDTGKKDADGNAIKELHYVFPNTQGAVENLPNIISRGLCPPQMRAGVIVDTGEKDDKGKPVLKAKYTGLHALRHWFASWCINAKDAGGLGLDPKAVQARMGHSSITMTMDVYGHLFPSIDDEEELAKAESALLA